MDGSEKKGRAVLLSRPPDMIPVRFCICHIKTLVYETLVNTEDLVARNILALHDICERRHLF